MAKRHRRLGTIPGALGLALVMTGPASAALHRGSRSTSPAGSAVSTPRQRPTTRSRRSPTTCRAASRLCSPSLPARSSARCRPPRSRQTWGTRPSRSGGTIVAADATTTVTVSGQQVQAQRGRDAVHGHRDAWRVLDPQLDRLRSDAAGAGVRRRRAADRPTVRHREQHDSDLPPAAGRACGHAGPCDVRREARLGHVHLRGVQRPTDCLHVARCGHAVHPWPRDREPGRHRRGAVRRPDRSR